MEPIDFPEANFTLNAPLGQEMSVNPMRARSEKGVFYSKWHLSFWERVNVLFFGTVWLGIWSGTSQPPVYLQASQNFNFINGRQAWNFWGFVVTSALQPKHAPIFDGVRGVFQDGCPWSGIAIKTWVSPKNVQTDLKVAICFGLKHNLNTSSASEPKPGYGEAESLKDG